MSTATQDDIAKRFAASGLPAPTAAQLAAVQARARLAGKTPSAAAILATAQDDLLTRASRQAAAVGPTPTPALANPAPGAPAIASGFGTPVGALFSQPLQLATGSVSPVGYAGPSVGGPMSFTPSPIADAMSYATPDASAAQPAGGLSITDMAIIGGTVIALIVAIRSKGKRS